MFLRVGAAGGCGALIGIERESRNQLAGMRTHALVAAGAAIFTIAGAYGFGDIHRGPNVDPMRVSAQIASGIGFIGAGAIIRDRGNVRGITTAAALWTSAAIGLAAGAGLWWLVAAGAVVTLFVLVALRPLRAHLITPLTTPLRTVDIQYEKGHGTLGPVMEAIRQMGGEFDDLNIEDENEGSTRKVMISVRVPEPDDLGEVAKELSEIPEVISCTVRGSGRASATNGAR
jgi:putative Mg2+ transporter-C (MgtC) family protein